MNFHIKMLTFNPQVLVLIQKPAGYHYIVFFLKSLGDIPSFFKKTL